MMSLTVGKKFGPRLACLSVSQNRLAIRCRTGSDHALIDGDANLAAKFFRSRRRLRNAGFSAKQSEVLLFVFPTTIVLDRGFSQTTEKLDFQTGKLVSMEENFKKELVEMEDKFVGMEGKLVSMEENFRKELVKTEDNLKKELVKTEENFKKELVKTEENIEKKMTVAFDSKIEVLKYWIIAAACLTIAFGSGSAESVLSKVLSALLK